MSTPLCDATFFVCAKLFCDIQELARLRQPDNECQHDHSTYQGMLASAGIGVSDDASVNETFWQNRLLHSGLNIFRDPAPQGTGAHQGVQPCAFVDVGLAYSDAILHVALASLMQSLTDPGF